MHTHQQTTSGAGTLPFPIDRCRPPSLQHSPLREDKLACTVAAARRAERFRDLSPAAAQAAIGAVLRDGGAGQVAQLLEENRIAVAAFSAVLATLIEADQRIAAAADRVLTAAGLPSEVR